MKDINTLLIEAVELLNESAGMGKNTHKYMKNLLEEKYKKDNDPIDFFNGDILIDKHKHDYEENTKKIAELKKEFNKEKNPITKKQISDKIKDMVEHNRKLKKMSEVGYTNKKMVDRGYFTKEERDLINEKAKLNKKKLKEILKK